MENQKAEKEIKRLNKLVCDQEIEYNQLLKTCKRVEKRNENLERIIKVAINMEDEYEALKFLESQFARTI